MGRFSRKAHCEPRNERVAGKSGGPFLFAGSKKARLLPNDPHALYDVGRGRYMGVRADGSFVSYDLAGEIAGQAAKELAGQGTREGEERPSVSGSPEADAGAGGDQGGECVGGG